MTNMDGDIRASARRVEQPWGLITWLVDNEIVAGAEMGLARIEIDTGAALPKHRHPNCNEAIHLIEGEIEQTIGSRVYPMKPGETMIVPADTVHSSKNMGTGKAILMFAFSVGDRGYELEE